MGRAVGTPQADDRCSAESAAGLAKCDVLAASLQPEELPREPWQWEDL